MTFWLFRKPRLYRILAPLEPQPRPAPRREHHQLDGLDEQLDETDLAVARRVARRAAPTRAAEEMKKKKKKNRDGLAVPQIEGS